MIFRGASNKFTQSFAKWRRQRKTNAARTRARRRFLEQLETRDLMALSILSVSPADGATNVPVDSNLVITFNENVLKGQGNVHVVRESTNTLGIAVDVNSTAVSISGAVVTIDLPTNLQLDNSYYVLIDDGAFVDTSSTSTPNATLLTQNFDLLALSPFATQAGGDGTDYTLDPPLGWSRDNAAMASGGVPEWQGWSFADKNSWSNSADDQFRSAFTLANGTVALGDPDQFDDATNGGPFNGALLTRAIKLTGVAQDTAVLEFDSSFRPEDSQIGKLEVSFDGGAWQSLLVLDPTNTSNADPSPTNSIKNVNEHLTSGINTAVSSDGKGNAPFRAVLNPAGATSAQFRFNVEGKNDWWWAIDNLKVKGTLTGVPFTGVTSTTFWNFAAPESPRLTVTIDRTSMSENGGTAIGTVTRNNLPTGAVVVNLTSNDTTEATVPASVTILDGQSSATFTITAVDDTLSDRTQIATVTAADAASVYATGSRTINVLDDEGPKIVSLSPADNATGVDYKSNLVMTLDGPVRKGNGLIKVIKTSTNTIASSIDVNSSNVTVAGAVVTIDVPVNLEGLTNYHVLMDDGTFYDLSSTTTPNAVLLSQDFEGLPLFPFVTEQNGDGTDFTQTAPPNFSVDNAGMPGGSNSDFNGWGFFDKNSWASQSGGQGRPDFLLGTGIVAVADSGEWDDSPHSAGGFNSFLKTQSIDLSTVAGGSVVLEFDSSYRPSLPQVGSLQVSYDGGGSWTEIMAFDNTDARNAHIVIDSSLTVSTVVGGGTIRNQLINPTSGNMQFRWGLLNGGDHWWWAVDNIKVRGSVNALPFQGISDPTTWNFTTAEAPTLTITIDKISMNENGGTAVGTVTRNLSTSTSPALTVTLNSNDTTEATVPGSVTIPVGAASITFPITAVDDLISDGTQTVVIRASAIDYFEAPASIQVLDDDFPKVISLSPADNSAAVPVGGNLVITYDQSVKKGSGFIHILRASDGKIGTSIDVRSSAVSISGAVVTINPPDDLIGLANYYVSVEPGAILSTLTTIKEDTVLLTQDFETLPLGPAVFETAGVTPDGKDFTTTPPAGWSVDNSLMPPGGIPEWTGWTVAAKSFWATQGGQNRANFTLGSGAIAVGETDEWDDTTTLNNNFNSLFKSSPIDLADVQANSVTLEFDSSFRPENSQVGTLDVTFDGGTNWSNLLTLDPTNTSNAPTSSNVNERRILPVLNPNGGSMQFRWRVTGANDWWWAIDNVKVTGDTAGLPYPGIGQNDTTTWNFATAEALTLSLTTADATISENGGTTTATVTRNLGTSGPLVVNLVSSNTSLTTVPASVTILDGQTSVTFPITAVDDLLADGRRNVVITASTAGAVSGNVTVGTLDNETVDVIVTEIMFNPVTSEPRGEWMELTNRGNTTADLSGWKFDDEDIINWTGLPAGTQLGAGKTMVVFNSFFNSITAATFRTEWAVPADAVVVGALWGDLDNSPAIGNEVITLRDAANVTLNLVNYDDDGTVWPAALEGPSIYLTNLTADNNVGTNWARSVVGTAGAKASLGPTYNVGDIGSPGTASANTVPVIGSNSAAVSGAEGTTITNTGTWSDANASDVVTLTASVGTVVKNANGTWSWSIASTDNQAAATVTITANDGNGGVSTTSFTYTVNNVAPVVAATNSAVSGIVLTTITNTGTYADVAADTVTLTASIGTIVNNGNGTWSWSITPSAGINNQTVTITAADEDSGSSTTTFSLTAVVDVVDRKLFYNGSGFETVGGVAAALDTSKVMLRSGATTQTTAFANVSNYTRGINGAVLDVAGLASTALTAADFILRVAPAGASGVVNPSTWTNAPTPSALVVTAGTATTPAQVQLEWTDNQIQNTWLQIIVRANANTGLTTPAVFYLGHAQAEINGVAPYRVSVADLSPVQTGISTNLVGVNDLRDLNKDRRVTVADLSFVQARVSTNVNLNNITVPIAGSTEEGASGSGGGGGGAGGAIFMQSAPSIASLSSKVGESIVSSSQPVARDVALATMVSGPMLISRVSSSLSMDLVKQIQPQPTSEEAADEFFAKLGQQF